MSSSLRLLLNFNFSQLGNTPLHQAVICGNSEMVKQLLLYKANVDIKNNVSSVISVCINFGQRINPRHMCEGYCSHSVCELVCVCPLPPCYIPVLYVENKVPLGFRGLSFKIRIVWISLKTLCSKVLTTFAHHCCFICFLLSSRSMKVTATASFQEDQCVDLAIVHVI